MATRVSAFFSRAPAAANFTAAARPTRLTRQRSVVASASGNVPPNVAEARAWIAAWKAKQQGAAAAAPASVPAAAEVATAGSNGKGKTRRRQSTGAGKAAAEPAAPAAAAQAAAAPAAVAESAPAPAPAPEPVNKMAATAMKDGTLVFTADQLRSIDYSDVMKK